MKTFKDLEFRWEYGEPSGFVARMKFDNGYWIIVRRLMGFNITLYATDFWFDGKPYENSDLERLPSQSEKDVSIIMKRVQELPKEQSSELAILRNELLNIVDKLDDMLQ